MNKPLNLEEAKKALDRCRFLLANKLTRADMAYVLVEVAKKNDEYIAKLHSEFTKEFERIEKLTKVADTKKQKGIHGEEINGLLKQVESDIKDLRLKLESGIKRIDRQLENDYIEKQYEIHDGKFYSLMKENILYNLPNESLKGRMQQCFDAYETDKYYVCACGLLPLLERIMVKSKTSLKYNWENIEKDFKKEFKSYFDKNVENDLEEYTIKLIVGMLADKIQFYDNEPDEFNRHWLLHGRCDRLPTKADCLKLFNIIELIINIKSKKRCPN